MKTFATLLAFSLTAALAQGANAADQDQMKHSNKKQAPARQTVTTQAPRFEHSARVRQYTPVNQAPHVNPVYTNQTLRVHRYPNQDVVRSNRLNPNSEFTPRIRTNPRVVTTTPQTTTTAQANINPRPNFDPDDRNRNNSNNWRNRTTDNSNWTNSNWNRDRHHHDRDWWRHHYRRFALFGGGYYYWDNNYWYPAYGYDPYYSTYSYDEPIYSYQDRDPGQVIASVQTELQRLGYYRYAVDGLMGPATRAALATFQRDNGLSMTARIDRQTLATLGLG